MRNDRFENFNRQWDIPLVVAMRILRWLTVGLAAVAAVAAAALFVLAFVAAHP
jgi:hypothetical protein